MKLLIIQIPCLNESETLPSVLEELPQAIDGIDRIETMVIDDGSSDGTAELAEKMGVDHVLRNVGNKGLGNTFRRGLDYALQQGADILINTDGDNQYPGRYIPELVRPIIEGAADMVVGDRQTSQIKHFSPVKKFFQKLGTWMTKILSGGIMVDDAVSGFRAYSREAMLQLNVTNQFSYVLDTTVQAANKRIKTVSIPITTNRPTRPSRLFTNIWQHIRKSGIGLLRTFAFYKPLRLFFGAGFLFIVLGMVPVVRFLYHYFLVSADTGKIQSLIIGGMMMSIGVNCLMLGIIGDLMGRNRFLIEDILIKLKRRDVK